jgi:Rrf2 family protein
MLRLSKKTDYTLMTMKHLASDPRRRAASAREIADSSDIPIGLMAKVLTRLIGSGLLISHRGAHGGYDLAECSILEVVARPRTIIGSTCQADVVAGPVRASAL